LKGVSIEEWMEEASAKLVNAIDVAEKLAEDAKATGEKGTSFLQFPGKKKEASANTFQLLAVGSE